MHIVPHALDEPRLIRGIHPICLGTRKSFFQKFRRKRLRRLRQHHALARHRTRYQRHVLRQAGALYFLDRVHRRDAQNRRFAPPRFFDHARDLLRRHEGPHRVVHQHDFRVVRHLAQRRSH